jgi:hypothetical protein
MNEQELNKKLAEWAGFRQIGKLTEHHHPWWVGKNDCYLFDELPDFTQSLDACFKWLVPKAITRICHLFKVDIKQAYKTLFQWWLDERFKLNDTDLDALALCKVIEKLNEKEVNRL